MSRGWPVEVTTLRPVKSGAVVWRTQGRICLTVVTKATFGMVPDGIVRLVAPVELSLGERHRDDNPARSLSAGGDVDPYKPRVDVLFHGHAYAPGGRAEAAVAVRLGLYGSSGGLEKTLHVVGERSPSASHEPQPFLKLPIEWERAAVGSGVDENPVGVPAGAADRMPNILDPANPDQPAGFGPIARTWPRRLRYLGGGTAPREQGAVLDVPETLAWDYFQVAPSDQQVATLNGDEQVVLDNLHAKLPRIQSQLPSARGVARVFGGDAPSDGFPIDLDLDTLSIDGDRQTVSLVWRGCLMIEGDPAELSGLRVVTGVEMPGFPMPWHQVQPAILPSPASAPSIDAPESTRDGEGGTLAFSPEEAQRLIASAAMRVAGSQEIKPTSSPPSARSAPPPAPPRAPRVSQLDLESYRTEAEENTGVTNVTEITKVRPLVPMTPAPNVQVARPAEALPDFSHGDEVTNFDETSRFTPGAEAPSSATGQTSGGGTRALTPEESAALLAKAPKGPPLDVPAPPPKVPASRQGQSTRALTPEESARLLANAPSRSPLAAPPAQAHPSQPAPLPGASQFLAQARDGARPRTAAAEEDLTDEETGATLAVDPDVAARMLAQPVRAVVRTENERPPRAPSPRKNREPDE